MSNRLLPLVAVIVIGIVGYVIMNPQVIKTDPCPKDDSVSPSSVHNLPQCFQKLWLEAGCTPNGSLYNDTVNTNSSSYKYWANLPTMKDVKHDMSEWYRLSRAGSSVHVDGCRPRPPP